MAVIKQLVNLCKGKMIYPKTITKAVYDENGERLDNILHDTILATDNEEYSGVEPRDADTLGGKYTKEDIEALIEENNELRNALEIYDDVVFTPSDNITVSTDATRLHRQGNHIYGILRVINTSRRNGLIKVGTLNYAPLTTYPMYCFDGGDITGNIDIPTSFILQSGEISIRTDSYIGENHALIFAIDFYTN